MTTANLEMLTERASLSGGRVNTANHVIEGVKILGTESKNGRSYPLATIRAAAAKYEGAKVNVNHPEGNPKAPRDYRDRLGSVRGVRVEGSGLYGNLHYNPAHPVAAMLEYDAQHSPESVGLSHNVEARTSRANGKTIIEEITRVVSVDVVSDPATTGGLYESLSAAGGEEFLTLPELRGRLNIGGKELESMLRKAGIEEAPVYSLNAVRAALAKITATPTAAAEARNIFSKPTAEQITEFVSSVSGRTFSESRRIEMGRQKSARRYR